jgi:hypothetical protein
MFSLNYNFTGTRAAGFGYTISSSVPTSDGGTLPYSLTGNLFASNTQDQLFWGNDITTIDIGLIPYRLTGSTGAHTNLPMFTQGYNFYQLGKAPAKTVSASNVGKRATRTETPYGTFLKLVFIVDDQSNSFSIVNSANAINILSQIITLISNIVVPLILFVLEHYEKQVVGREAMQTEYLSHSLNGGAASALTSSQTKSTLPVRATSTQVPAVFTTNIVMPRSTTMSVPAFDLNLSSISVKTDAALTPTPKGTCHLYICVEEVVQGAQQQHQDVTVGMM